MYPTKGSVLNPVNGAFRPCREGGGRLIVQKIEEAVHVGTEKPTYPYFLQTVGTDF